MSEEDLRIAFWQGPEKNKFQVAISSKNLGDEGLTMDAPGHSNMQR